MQSQFPLHKSIEIFIHVYHVFGKLTWWSPSLPKLNACLIMDTWPLFSLGKLSALTIDSSLRSLLIQWCCVITALAAYVFVRKRNLVYYSDLWLSVFNTVNFIKPYLQDKNPTLKLLFSLEYALNLFWQEYICNKIMHFHKRLYKIHETDVYFIYSSLIFKSIFF